MQLLLVEALQGTFSRELLLLCWLRMLLCVQGQGLMLQLRKAVLQWSVPEEQGTLNGTLLLQDFVLSSGTLTWKAMRLCLCCATAEECWCCMLALR